MDSFLRCLARIFGNQSRLLTHEFPQKLLEDSQKTFLQHFQKKLLEDCLEGRYPEVTSGGFPDLSLGSFQVGSPEACPEETNRGFLRGTHEQVLLENKKLIEDSNKEHQMELLKIPQKSTSVGFLQETLKEFLEKMLEVF